MIRELLGELYMDERFTRVARNSQEVVTKAELKKLLESKENFNFYYGTAPTGPFHTGYLIPLGKILDCMEAGGKATILIADYHAYLDDRKTPWEEMKIRSEYYQKCIELILGNATEKIKFIKGSSFQAQSDYTEDLFKVSGLVTTIRAKRAASEVTRMKKPKVSELMYPLMQSLDVKYLDSELVIGGTDQRHIYMLSREILPEVGHPKPICIFTPLIMSLKGHGQKMSASVPRTHIKVHETEKDLKKLIYGAYCPPKNISNPIIEISRYVVFPLSGKIDIDRPRKFGGRVEYENFEDLKKNYKDGKLHPKDLKQGVFDSLSLLLKPVRDYFDKHQDFVNAIRKTYGW